MSAIPNLNDAGQITFAASLRTTPTGTTSAGSGIWMRGANGTVTLLARDGNAAPGVTGGTFASMVRPALNNAGEYAFSATMAVAGAVTDANNAGVWIARDGNPLSLLVREDTHAPGTGAAVAFATFSELVVDTQGRAAFFATLTGMTGGGPSGITTANDTGLWSERTGDFALVAREGDQAAGLPAGLLYSTFLGPTLNAGGQVAFAGTVTGPGVTTTTDGAIWAQDAGGILHLIVRDGDQLDVDDTAGVDFRTVSAAAFFTDGGPEDGTRSGFNASGHIAFIASFTDGTSGVFVSNLAASTTQPLAGDFTENGVVNGFDLANWRAGFGTAASATHSQGDSDGDGDVDGRDFLTWQEQTTSAGSASAAPEPAAGVLVLAALNILGASGRRR
jgi:hypothetical protein